MLVILRTTISRGFSTSATMGTQKSNYLINGKYSFLKELGLGESNLGVYDGNWKGSGQVSFVIAE